MSWTKSRYIGIVLNRYLVCTWAARACVYQEIQNLKKNFTAKDKGKCCNYLQTFSSVVLLELVTYNIILILFYVEMLWSILAVICGTYSWNASLLLNSSYNFYPNFAEPVLLCSMVVITFK